MSCTCCRQLGGEGSPATTRPGHHQVMVQGQDRAGCYLTSQPVMFSHPAASRLARLCMVAATRCVPHEPLAKPWLLSG